MTWFVVRVQLAGEPSGAIYQTLHEEMASLGYVRSVTSDDGVDYRLPHAVYFADLDWTREPGDVHDEVRDVVAAIWPSEEILVAHTDSLTWSGMPRISRARRLLDR